MKSSVRGKTIQCRVSDREWAKILEAAQNQLLTVSEYARYRLLKTPRLAAPVAKGLQHLDSAVTE